MSEELIDPIVKQALKKLLDPTSYFDVCLFDKMCRVMNVIPPPGHRDRLGLLHCIHFRDMETEVREELGRLVFETINTGGFNVELKAHPGLGQGKVRYITGQRDA